MISRHFHIFILKHYFPLGLKENALMNMYTKPRQQNEGCASKSPKPKATQYSQVAKHRPKRDEGELTLDKSLDTSHLPPFSCDGITRSYCKCPETCGTQWGDEQEGSSERVSEGVHASDSGSRGRGVRVIPNNKFSRIGFVLKSGTALRLVLRCNNACGTEWYPMENSKSCLQIYQCFLCSRNLENIHRN